METLPPTILTLIGDQYAPFLLDAVKKAKQTINILMFDWRWYPTDPAAPVQLINQAILQAKKRGVQVRAIVDTDSSLAFFSEIGLDVKQYFGKGLMHAKMFVIDGKLTVLGSHNLTMNGLTYNHETSVAITDAEMARKLNNFFVSLWLL